MKIAVIRSSGRVGSRIGAAALSRGALSNLRNVRIINHFQMLSPQQLSTGA